ncbi:Opi1-domain-containing protein [Auricularia subglabra TFB-10046 SS5]|nr:Opi1-domain-containing protein [Auricularia subglabra TFB-10046 SS5]
MSAARMAVSSLCAPAPLPTPASSSPHGSPQSPSMAEMDESELIAAAALRGMRQSRSVSELDSRSAQATPALSLSSSASYSTLSDAAQYTPGSSRTRGELEPEYDVGDADMDGVALVGEGSEDFVSRVARVPLVNSALRAYEHSKNSSRVVKYGAEMVESSVKTISRPVIGRLPVGSLDEFACRQLDKWGPRYAGAKASPDATPMQLDERSRSRDRAPERGRSTEAERGRKRQRNQSAMSASPEPQPEAGPSNADASASATDPDTAKAVAVRSTWQAMLMEAGGISAAVSEESMKRLKYCLQWLQYATGRIDHQILILRDFIASVTPEGAPQESNAVISPLALKTLNDVKQDVVQTIRDVVDVVSKYAGGALPEHAKATVRAFILHLPQRWATRMQDEQPAQPELQPGQPPTVTVASQAAHRILGLATESLDMMRSVTGVFKDSLDRAETWVERLRVVGIQRPIAQGEAAWREPGAPPSEAGDDDDDGAPLSPSGTGTGPPLSPVGSTSSIGASLDALSLAAALQHQQSQQQYQLRGGGPRFTLGSQGAGGMDVDDEA